MMDCSNGFCRAMMRFGCIGLMLIQACTQSGNDGARPTPNLEAEQQRIALEQNRQLPLLSLKLIRSDGSDVTGQAILQQGERFGVEATAMGVRQYRFTLRQSTKSEANRTFGAVSMKSMLVKSPTDVAAYDPMHDDTPEVVETADAESDNHYAVHQIESKTPAYQQEVASLTRYEMAEICESDSEQEARRDQCHIPQQMMPGPYTIVLETTDEQNQQNQQNQTVLVLMVVPAPAPAQNEPAPQINIAPPPADPGFVAADATRRNINTRFTFNARDDLGDTVAPMPAQQNGTETLVTYRALRGMDNVNMLLTDVSVENGQLIPIDTNIRWTLPNGDCGANGFPGQPTVARITRANAAVEIRALDPGETAQDRCSIAAPQFGWVNRFGNAQATLQVLDNQGNPVGPALTKTIVICDANDLTTCPQ